MPETELIIKTIIEDPEGIVAFATDKTYCYTFFTASYSEMIEARTGTRIQIGKCAFESSGNSETKNVYNCALARQSFSAEEELSDSFMQPQILPHTLIASLQ